MLNKQLMKLLPSFPFCITLENPIFRLSLIHSLPLESTDPEKQRLLQDLTILSPIGNNDEGSMFIKYFTVNRQITSLLFI